MYENEPSDAETIDSESSDDEREASDDSASETEPTVEPEEQVVPKLEKENICSEVTTSDSSTTERVRPLLCGRHLKQQTADNSRQLVSAQLDGVKRSCASSGTAVCQTTAAASSTASVGASAGSCSIDSGVVSVKMELSNSDFSWCGTRSSVHCSEAQINNARLTTNSVRSRRIVPTFCGTVTATSSVTQEPAVSVVIKVEPESSERLLNRTYAVLCDDDTVKSSKQLLSETFNLSPVSRHNLTYSVSAAEPHISEASTVTAVVKCGRTSSADVEPSLGKCLEIDVLPVSNHPLILDTPAVRRLTNVEAFNKRRGMCGRDLSHLPSTKLVESLGFQRHSVAPWLSSGLQQGLSTKTVSVVLHRPVVTTSCTISAVTDHQPTVESDCVGHDCLIMSSSSRPVNSTVSKQASSEISSSAKLVSECCKSGVGCRDNCVSVRSSLVEVSGCENHHLSVVELPCNDSYNNPTESECMSATGLASVRTDVDQKSSQRRFRGFAASTPLRDSSPPPPDMSFCSLSSISLASDQEDYDANVDTVYSIESDDDDDVVLLNVGFVSDSHPASLQSAMSPDVAELKSQHSSSSKTDSAQPPKSGQTLSQNLSKFQPVSASNCLTTRSCRLSNSRDIVKTRCSKLSNAVGRVVRPVPTKRTRCEVSSSSSSDSEEGTLTKQNPHAMRNTRARLSARAESIDISVCLGPSRCNKAICFNCHRY